MDTDGNESMFDLLLLLNNSPHWRYSKHFKDMSINSAYTVCFKLADFWQNNGKFDFIDVSFRFMYFRSSFEVYWFWRTLRCVMYNSCSLFPLHCSFSILRQCQLCSLRYKLCCPYFVTRILCKGYSLNAVG